MIINTDASFNDIKKIGKVAVIIKNDEGEILDHITDHVVCNTSTQAELYAIMEAIYYLDENLHKDHKVKIITDCQSIACLFNSNSMIQKVLGNKKCFKGIDKAKVLEVYMRLQILRIRNKITLKWTPRKHNTEADKLSKMFK